MIKTIRIIRHPSKDSDVNSVATQQANIQIAAVRRYAAALRDIKPNSESKDGAFVALAELESIINRAKHSLNNIK